MLWIFLAISAHFFWALMNVGDKYIIENKIKNPYVYLVWVWLLSIVVVAIVPFIDFYMPEMKLMIWLTIAGALWFLGGLLYIKAVQIEEITRINIWWNLIPLFTLFIGWIAINQRLNYIQIFAFIILIIGAIIGSVRSQGKKIVISKAILLMLVACLFFALYAVIFSHITTSTSFIVAFVWISILLSLFSLSLFVSSKFRKDFVQELKQLDGKLGAMVISISLLDHLGIFFNAWALSLGIAALVFAMEGFQVIFVFALTVLISFIYKSNVLKEELDRKNVMLKLVAIVFMIIGVAVLAFN
jgi:drug/metabolite transporter (DMT)-like permease